MRLRAAVVSLVCSPVCSSLSAVAWSAGPETNETQMKLCRSTVARRMLAEGRNDEGAGEEGKRE